MRCFIRLWNGFIILLVNGVLKLSYLWFLTGWWGHRQRVHAPFDRAHPRSLGMFGSFPKPCDTAEVQMRMCLALQKKKKKKNEDVLWNQTPEASDSFLIALLILLVQVCATSFQMFSSRGGEGFFQISPLYFTALWLPVHLTMSVVSP